ncbi:transcriptional regulator, TetR family [Agromyces sp. CF514]|uniref:TetR/AcrR family transcriptional regulator n=1 Tax=Agromyces sp. CF514 TaxID=1881031 RepID=UPI0008E6A18C|nr:TetR/AcrR family transcriptional regulator [Agromyces sp. CF514]SFR70911.1 transcriptional regulator, TetR family [Agromyces sp. CF514]
MTARTYHHGNLRQVLLDHAWRTLDVDGLAALSLRQLARDAGVSHGASARHFRDKQALLDALGIAGFAQLNGDLATAAAGPAPFEERFRRAGLAYVSFAVEHPAILANMYSAKHHADASADLVQLSHAGMAALVDLINDAQHAGAVLAGDAAELALVAFAAVHGVATLAVDDLLNGTSWHDAAEATISFIWRGLADPTSAVGTSR